MLSGGNPTGGSNPSGTGSSINYVGKHAYAYSGTFPQSTNAATMLNFETGGQYIVGTLTCAGAVEFATPQSGGITGFKLSINNEVIFLADTETNENDQPGTISVDLILAPYSRVKLENISNSNDANELTTALFTGEVYA